MEGKKEGRIKV